MDRAGFQTWLDRYVAAWRSNDAGDIEALFTEDAHYSYHPYDEDIVGRGAIVASWLDAPDDPSTWEARYEAWAVEGDRGAGVGRSRYWDAGVSHDDPPGQEYANVYLVTFGPDGRASEFRESYIEPREAPRERQAKAVAEAVEAARAEWTSRAGQTVNGAGNHEPG